MLKKLSRMSKKDFIVAEKITENGLLLVVSDKELIGKKFLEGKKQLDLTNKFYLGEEMDENEVNDLFKMARHIHLTGPLSINLGVTLGYVDKDKILFVQKIPHAECFVER